MRIGPSGNRLFLYLTCVALVSTSCSGGGTNGTLPLAQQNANTTGVTALLGPSTADAFVPVDVAASAAPALTAGSQKTGSLVAVRAPAATTSLFSDNFEDQNYSQWSRIDGWWSSCHPVSRTYGLCAAQVTDNAMFAGSYAWTDYTLQSDLVISKIASGREGMDVMIRAKDANHFYTLQLVKETDGSLQWEIWRNNGGTYINLARGSTNFTVGGVNVLRFQAQGSVLTASLSQDNGATFAVLGTGTDSLFPAGKIGLHAWSGMLGSFDNVSVTTTQGSPAPTPSAPPTSTPPPTATPTQQPTATPTASPTAVPTAVPTSTPIATGGNHVIAGCSIFPGDPRFHRDITNAAVSSNSASIIASSASLGHFGTLEGAGKYLLHIQTDANQPVTTIAQQLSYHAFPDKWPIAGYTSQSQATGSAGDRGMEVIQLGTANAGGCMMWDAYNLVYLGQNYPASPNFSGYSGCKIDPSKFMPTTGGPCNSTSGWGGVSIDGGVFPEEVTGTGPGWSHSPTHALIIEIPQSSKSPLLNTTTKIRLRASFPEPSNAQAKFIVDSLKTYGAFTVENGCCFNIARTWVPQPGHTDISFGSVDPIVQSIGIGDFAVMASND